MVRSVGLVWSILIIAGLQAKPISYMDPLGMRFEEMLPGTSYVSRGPGFDAEFTRAGATLAVGAGSAAARLHFELVGADKGVRLVPEAPMSGRTNWLTGSDSSQWRTSRAFAQVRYRQVYPGIDMLFHSRNQAMEFDFVVRPGASADSIAMRVSGAKSLTIDAVGDLVLSTSAGELRWKRPDVYQRRGEDLTPVEGTFRLQPDGVVRFDLGRYDRKRELIIDPMLSYSSYLGGANNDGARAIAVDSAGNIYIAGATTTQDLPVSHAVQAAYGGNTAGLLAGDAFVAKFSPAGALVYLTYLGGSADDFITGLYVDSGGNAYVTGGTSSTNFPVTNGAYRTQPAGAGGNGLLRMGDAFVAKIAPAGDTLLYSYYFGGNLDDYGSAITLDGAGNIYITGGTLSRDLPATAGVVQSNFKGAGGEFVFPRYGTVPFNAGDVFIAKFNPAGSQLLLCTYLGGSADDLSTAVAVDGSGNIFVGGNTLSTDYPTTNGAFQRANRGSDLFNNIFWVFGDGFVSKLNASASSLVYSTYLGGTCDDFVSSIVVNSGGEVYAGGATCSTDFPVPPGSLQTQMRGPFSAPVADVLIGDAFVAKLNSAGTALSAATFLGGNSDDAVSSIALDAAGNVFVAGFTNSSNFPVSGDAAQKNFAGGGQLNEHQNFGDAFLVELNPAISSLMYGTYLGGSFDDEAMALGLDKSGAVYLAGSTVSSNFPVMANPAKATFGGSSGLARYRGDAFVAKLSGFSTAQSDTTSVAAITNAADYTAGIVSPGMNFVVFGSKIGPTALSGAELLSNGLLSTNVANTRILFDGVPAPIVYVSSGQSSGMVPYSVAGKSSTNIVVEYQGQQSAPLTAQVRESVPALYSANLSGTGQGAIFNQDGKVNSAGNPANRGDIIVLYGTGEGQTNPPGVDGLITPLSPPRAEPALPLTVTIGGWQVAQSDISYKGPVPDVVAGVFQINVRVPTTINDGSQPVLVKFGSFQSQANLTVALR